MPAGKDVRPAKWSDVRDLYDDGEYSAIWGRYDNHALKCVGVRWNNSYPAQGEYPLWYVEPDFMTEAVLQRLLSCAVERGDETARCEILKALDEATKQICARTR
jgi:hypothetical protein